jgi:hypothetical protein
MSGSDAARDAPATRALTIAERNAAKARELGPSGRVWPVPCTAFCSTERCTPARARTARVAAGTVGTAPGHVSMPPGVVAPPINGGTA